MVDEERLWDYMVNHRYLTPREAMYDQRHPFKLEPLQWARFLAFKDKKAAKKEDPFMAVGLSSFDGHPLHLAFCQELLMLSRLVLNFASDALNVSSTMGNRLHKDDVYGEIEGSLAIEGVKVSRKRIDELLRKHSLPVDRNDSMVENMGRALAFVLGRPDFNEENLHRLYSILTDGVLDETNRLREGELYRYDEVEVDSYPGAPHGQISSCMDSLFSYVVHILEKGDPMEKFLLPHVAHYYVAYIHPYFDYNGRTARMVSFWLSLLSIQNPPVFVSEAIDQTKNLYYRALENTRDSHNDLTYFIIYLLQITVSYYNCYRNVEYIDQLLKNKGIVLTEGERGYVKRILISNKGAFAYGDFLKWTKSDMSKQAAFKILNGLVRDGFLLARESRSKNKLFALNPEFAPYRMKYFNE